jgi:Double zinc ribbon
MENIPAPQAPTPIPPGQPAMPSTPSAPSAAVVPIFCPQCHQPVSPTAYFCPNCGKKLSEPGLSTSIGAQIVLYGFSIVLPIICYLAITKWEGIKYARSDDPKAQQMGWIAIGLLAISSIIVIWWTTKWIDGFIQTQTSTAGLSQYGI